MRSFVLAAGVLVACAPTTPARDSVAATETADVDSVIARERWRIKDCYNAALARDPKAGGNYKLRFEIDATGAVKRIVLVSSEGTPSLGDCLARAFLTVRFAPPGDGAGEFTVPIVLSSVGVPKTGPMTCSRREFAICDTTTIDDAALATLATQNPEEVFVVFRENARNADVATIARWPQVRRLMIRSPEIDDISGLAGLKDMEFLALLRTKVTNIAAVASMKKLRFLDLKGSPVSDLGPLAKHTGLEVVLLAETAVTDLWPLLASAKSLRRLVVPKTVPEAALATFRAANPAIDARIE